MSITVKATELGYYGMQRRRVGERFEIASEKEFSGKWMKKVKARPVGDEDEDDEQKARPTSKSKAGRANDESKI